MGISYKIGDTSYTDLKAAANGRKAISIEVGAEEYSLRRFHVPGADGNIVIRMGRVAQQIICTIMYIGESLTVARGYFEADKTAFKNTAVSITDDGGNIYESCNLINFVVAESPQATGRVSGQVYFVAIATFTMDA